MAVTHQARAEVSPTSASIRARTGALLSIETAHLLFVCLTSIGVLLYIVRIWTIYAAGELFHRIGFDWTMFYAQAMVLHSGDGSNMYDVARIQAGLQSLATYYTASAAPSIWDSVFVRRACKAPR